MVAEIAHVHPEREEPLPTAVEHSGNNLAIKESAVEYAWKLGGLAVRKLVLWRDTTSKPEDRPDYDPVRYAHLEPEEIVKVETDTGTYPAYLYNMEYFPGVNETARFAPVAIHMSLLTRADQGISQPFIKYVKDTCDQQQRGLLVIGGPGSGGEALRRDQLGKLDLHSIVESTHEVIDRASDLYHFNPEQPMVHTGASLGGLISLVLADEALKEKRDMQGRPLHEVAGTAPIAPAGWELNWPQRINAARQFLLLEGGHALDKLSRMEADKRQLQLQSFVETIPRLSAILPAGKLALKFIFDGDLKDTIDRLPRDLPIRGVVFDGDFITLPSELINTIAELGFKNSRIEKIRGAHLSLTSEKKAYRRTIKPLLDEDFKNNLAA